MIQYPFITIQCYIVYKCNTRFYLMYDSILFIESKFAAMQLNEKKNPSYMYVKFIILYNNDIDHMLCLLYLMHEGFYGSFRQILVGSDF